MFTYSPKIRWLETSNYEYILTTSKHIKLFYTVEENDKSEVKEKPIQIKRLPGDIICSSDICNELFAFGNNRGCVYLTDLEDPLHRIVDIRPEYSNIDDCLIRDIKFNRDDPNVIAVTADSLHSEHPGSIVNVYDLGEFCHDNEGLPCIYNASFGHRVLSLNWLDSNRYLVSSANQMEIYSRNCNDEVVEKLIVEESITNVVVEPNQGNALACYANGKIYIYDLRRFRQPIYIIDTEFSTHENKTKHFIELGWNKNSHYDLSILYKGYPLYSVTSFASSDFCTEKPLLKSRKSYGKHDPGHPYIVLPIPLHQDDDIVSFDWHPSKKHQLITLSSRKKIFIDSIDLRGTAQICPTSKVVCTSFDNEILIRESYINIESKGQFDSKSGKKKKVNMIKDINDIMRQRAIKGFGYGESDDPLLSCITKCLQIIENDNDISKAQKRDLLNVWIWLSRMTTRGVENEIVNDKYRSRFPGMIEIAENGMGRDVSYSVGPRIKIEPKQKDTSSHGTSSSSDEDEVVIKYRFFQHPRRRDILKICGWPTVDDVTSQEYLSLKFEQDFSELPRSLTIAAFSGNLDLAKELSSRFVSEIEARDDHAKYLEVLKELDKILQSGVGKKLNNYDMLSEVRFYNQYLMALLIFVSVRKSKDNEKFKEIFELEQITFLDKIAFASLFLTDLEFFQECERIKETMVKKAQLSALIMMGLYNDQEVHQLFHNYIDRTGDIQNAALLLIIGDCTEEEIIYFDKRSLMLKEGETGVKERQKSIVNPDLFLYEIYAKRNVERSLIIIRCYMDLLNSWSLYLNRTFLGCLSKNVRSLNFTKDINDHFVSPTGNPVQVSICCNFCKEPITKDKTKVTQCETDMKHLSLYKRKEKKEDGRSMSCKNCRKPLPKCSICRFHFGTPMHEDEKINDETNSDNWFTWCTNCLHGGHKKHIVNWFRVFDICPVSGCGCLCIMRDRNVYKNYTKYKDSF
uniref:C2H2-type domain-containing protein n=1 Tax=Strongyloides papillosus TaxID=174720 RepID=A0A0N5B9W4_STREA